MLFEVKLFDSKREFFLFLGLIFLIFCINISYKYHIYKQIKSKPIYQTTAKVINQYIKTKHNRSFLVLKLRAKEGFVFYTTSREDLKDLYGDTLLLKFKTKKFRFIDMFKPTYIFAYDFRVIKKDRLKKKLLQKIATQHDNNITKELFQALFLAKPISKELREKVSNLGISHLIAISGFHLGVLFFVLYLLLEKPYKFLQDRFFPYRNRKFDLTVLIIFLLFGYLYLLGFVPSLVRSYVMLVIGFFLYDRFVKIISFEVLLVAVLFILAFLPEFFFSIGFWFSVSGVFFIYLFLNYFSKLKTWQIVLFLNIWVYFMMLPIIHSVFDKFTLLQLFSPLLSIAFTIFYPLELFLHLIGEGGLLDSFILKLLDLKSSIYHIKTPFWFLVGYIAIMIFLGYKVMQKKRED